MTRYGREATVKEVVDYVLRDANDINVVVGPLLWQPSDGVASKRWYFTIATSEESTGFRCDQVMVAGDDPEQRERMRLAVFADLVRHRPLIIHDMGDEVAMARMCELLWPGPRIAALRREVEDEYAKRT
jgi:hypothetical protein